MNKVFKIALLIALVCVIVPLCVWGVSRVMLKNAETTFVSGSVEEISWSAQQTYDPLDESLYHTFDVPKGTPFRVLALTDIHYRNGGWYGTWALNYQNDKTDSDIRKLVQEADPDLIIVCGDIETGTLNDKNYAHFVALMDDIGVPWTIVFGNHDAEHRADKAALARCVMQSACAVFRQGPTNLGIVQSECLDPSLYDPAVDPYAGGLGNTVIHLRDPGSGEIYYAFILMDTGDWQNLLSNKTAKNRADLGARPYSRTDVGLTNRQIEWYKWVVDGLTSYNCSVGVSAGQSTPESMLICHIGMKAMDYAAILSQYENSWGGHYTAGGYPNNDLPFHTEAEWSRPADRPYIEYDTSDERITSDPDLMEKVNQYNANAAEKEGNDAIAQYWILADNTQRTDYLNGKNETYPNPLHIRELVAVIDRAYAVHRENDLFLRAVLEKGSTRRIVTGHNHCDGYEVVFDGITYTSVVKTGDIYCDKECDMGNHGGSLFVITENHGEISVDSRAIYTKMQNIPSKRYPRPVQEW